MHRHTRLLRFIGLSLALLASHLAQAAELAETVLMVPKTSGFFSTELETTVYRPDRKSVV